MQEERAVALGDMVNGHPELIDPVLPELVGILRDPDDDYAFAEAIVALGHAWDVRATAYLLSLVSPAHPEARVRVALARALPSSPQSGACRAAVIKVLITLSSDIDDGVRDWACLGLGQLDADGRSVQNALAARLDDEHVDTRCEALVALAKTGDSRALSSVLTQLNTENPNEIRLLTLEGAAELADPDLLPTLVRLQLAWGGESDDHCRAFAYAVRRCQPGQRERARQIESGLVRWVNEQLKRAGSRRSIALSGCYPRTLLTLANRDGAPNIDFGRHRIWDDLIPEDDALGGESWLATILKYDQT